MGTLRPRGSTWVVVGLALFFFLSPLRATETDVTLDASERVFAVLAAASLAGLNPWLAEGQTPGAVSDLWTQLRLLPVTTIEPLRQFVAQHRQGTIQEDLSRYISLALVVSEPPHFEFLLPLQQLPPDVRDIQGFGELVKRFYGEAQLDRLWRRFRSAYEKELAQLQSPVSRGLLETRAYVRLVEGQTTLGRRYVMVVEWLVPPGLTSARNYADTYYLVVNPTQSDLLEAVRHQYLHFLVDPVVAKYADRVGERAELLEVARQAPRLPEAYRSDFLLLTIECLIQAIELRLAKVPDAEAAKRASEWERRGYILTGYFLGGLTRFEQVDPSFRFYFPELLAELDVASERARLQRVLFAPADASPATPEPLVVAGPAPLLAEAERQLTQGNRETARRIFERVLSEYNSEEPRALYGLAVIASLEREPERAQEFFERTARVARDPHILGWTHVYLGRLYDLAGRREEALAQYRAALALPGVSEKIQEAARRGVEAPYQPLLVDTQP
ncbi:MAG: tetratricopeptide repeat protein [Acidobacteria bacterium]|nr:tetratricopeptide repeat protein [Acidobacteriota bacterium]